MNSLSKRSNTVRRTTTAALCVLVPGFVFASCGHSESRPTPDDPEDKGGGGAAGEAADGGSGGSAGRGGSSSGRGGSGTGASGTGGMSGTTGGGDTGGTDAGSGGTTGGEGAVGGSAGSSEAGAGGCEGAGCGGGACPTELRCDGVCCGAPPPNATAFCEGNACAVRCDAHTLACTPTNGKPTCASWDFESATPEGWFVGNYFGGTNRNIPSGFTGFFETRTAHATTGSRSLAVGYQGDGFDYWLAELRIRFCQDSQPLDVNGLTLKFDVYAETAPGAMPFTYQSRNYVVFWNENQPPGYEQVFAACDWDGEPDEPMSVSCNVAYAAANATEMSILMRMFEPWRGTYYFDNIRLEPTPPPEP